MYNKGYLAALQWGAIVGAVTTALDAIHLDFVGFLALILFVPASAYVLHKVLQATPRPWNESTTRRMHIAGGLFVGAIAIGVAATLTASALRMAGLHLGSHGLPYAFISSIVMGIYFKASLRCEYLGLSKPTWSELLIATISFGR